MFNPLIQHDSDVHYAHGEASQHDRLIEVEEKKVADQVVIHMPQPIIADVMHPASIQPAVTIDRGFASTLTQNRPYSLPGMIRKRLRSPRDNMILFACWILSTSYTLYAAILIGRNDYAWLPTFLTIATSFCVIAVHGMSLVFGDKMMKRERLVWISLLAINYYFLYAFADPLLGSIGLHASVAMGHLLLVNLFVHLY